MGQSNRLQLWPTKIGLLIVLRNDINDFKASLIGTVSTGCSFKSSFCPSVVKPVTLEAL